MAARNVNRGRALQVAQRGIAGRRLVTPALSKQQGEEKASSERNARVLYPGEHLSEKALVAFWSYSENESVSLKN